MISTSIRTVLRRPALATGAWNSQAASLIGLFNAFVIAPSQICIQQQTRSATKKAGGSSNNGRTSQPKHLGVKIGNGTPLTHAQIGSIIVRQRGYEFHPGPGVGVGKDYSLHALRPGIVTFTYDLARQRRIVWIDEGVGVDDVGFGTRNETRRKLSDAIDAKTYLELDSMGRYLYALKVADNLVKIEEQAKRNRLAKRLETSTRGAFNLVDLTLV